MLLLPWIHLKQSSILALQINTYRSSTLLQLVLQLLLVFHLIFFTLSSMLQGFGIEVASLFLDIISELGFLLDIAALFL